MFGMFWIDFAAAQSRSKLKTLSAKPLTRSSGFNGDFNDVGCGMLISKDEMRLVNVVHTSIS